MRPAAGAYGAGVWHGGWATGGYWATRPWPYGWYGTAPLAWGVAGMASAAAITNSVNDAAAQQTTVIVVPQTGFQLNYACDCSKACSTCPSRLTAKPKRCPWLSARLRR